MSNILTIAILYEPPKEAFLNLTHFQKIINFASFSIDYLIVSLI